MIFRPHSNSSSGHRLRALHEACHHLQQRLAVSPLTEQRRIVAKVDELMALCDRLKASLTARDATRSRLLSALLAEALAAAVIPERQAAE